MWMQQWVQPGRAVIVWAVLIVGVLSACAAAPADNAAATNTGAVEPELHHHAYVVRHRLHTGLALPAHLLEDSPLAFVLALPDDADYYEIGLGDEVYYQLPRAGTSQLRRNALAARAMLLPTRAVMQVMPLSAHPKELPHTDIAPLQLTDTELSALMEVMVATFADTEADAAWAGERPRQWFFESNRRFWFRYTCNTWTADALTEAEQARWVVKPIRAGAVMRPLLSR